MKPNQEQNLTPIMEQFFQIKRKYEKEILLFRMGDFYEMFGSDAERAAPVLGLTLTSRAHGKSMPRVPLAGVPYHTVERYIKQLIKAGFHVAICDQVEDPKKSKGLVKREVVEVITPGTVLLDDILDHSRNNFLIALSPDEPSRTAIARIDITTGDFETALMDNRLLYHFLDSINPAEIIFPDHLTVETLGTDLSRLKTTWTPYADWKFTAQEGYAKLCLFFNVANLKGYGLEESPPMISAAGAILFYLEDKQVTLDHIRRIRYLRMEDYMLIDSTTRRNLELLEPLNPGETDTSLYALLNRAKTPMGARLLRQWILQPLLDPLKIHQRQSVVHFFYHQDETLENLRRLLAKIGDLERLISKINSRRCNARDLYKLKEILGLLPQIKSCLPEKTDSPLLEQLSAEMVLQDELIEGIEQALKEELPLSITEGGMIREGFSPELDELRGIAFNSKYYIAQMEKNEIEKTGINSLKIRYNKVFGYFIEITKSNLDRAPEEYIRKQTMVNAERYITPELKEYEEKVLHAEEKIFELEGRLFQAIRQAVIDRMASLQSIAIGIAELDLYLNLAFLAKINYYTIPEIVSDDRIIIKNGRHPVVEALLREQQYVPNDVALDTRESQIVIITGPNMAGKSTYLRMVGLLVVMAQMGSYIPAESAQIGVCDRVFTRVGASDNVARGESTFLVEMSETANILNNATPHSLIILDEVGRGTSTFDGLSLAWALVEYLHQQETTRARTLFATHYHELTELEILLPQVANYNVQVKKIANQIVFLRKIVPGSADQSYGIEVAALAGMPRELLERARVILHELEERENKTIRSRHSRRNNNHSKNKELQLSLFSEITDPVHLKISGLKMDTLSPIDAWQFLSQLQQQIKSEGG